AGAGALSESGAGVLENRPGTEDLWQAPVVDRIGERATEGPVQSVPGRTDSGMDSGFERRVGLGVLADSRLLIHSLRKPLSWFLFTQGFTLHCMSFTTPPNMVSARPRILKLTSPMMTPVWRKAKMNFANFRGSP